MRKLGRGARTTATVAGIAALGLTLTAGGAVAGSLVTSGDIKNQTIESWDIHRDGVGKSEIRKDAVGKSEVRKDGVGWYGELNDYTRNKIKNFAGEDGEDGARGPVGPEGPEGPPGPPASDVKGGLAAEGYTDALVSLPKIGGPYSDNATDLFTLDLPGAGTYLVNAHGYFDRLNEDQAGYEAPPTDTYLQLTVRGPVTETSKWGLDAGTCFSPPVSHRGFVETTCDSTTVVTVDEATTLTVRGFGYNENRGGFGGAPNSATPQFSVAAQVSAVKIG